MALKESQGMRSDVSSMQMDVGDGDESPSTRFLNMCSEVAVGAC